MSALFKIGRKINHLLVRSPRVRGRLRMLGMYLLTWPPYVDQQRKRLVTRHMELEDKDKAMIARVSCRIARSDTMFEGDVGTYLLVGLSALRAIERVLLHCPNANVGTILDLPCGCGRVSRFLAGRFPEAVISVCDLMKEGVDFCAKAFGSVPVYSQADFETFGLESKYDLIWCGSLLTHLNPKDIRALLGFMGRHLNTGGVFVFTAHGDYVAQRLESGADYGVTLEAARAAVASYRAEGFAFKSYIGRRESEQYGLSLTSPAWLRSQCAMFGNWAEVYFEARGWDGHQDVYGYRGR